MSKFKVGDKIVHKHTGKEYIVSKYLDHFNIFVEGYDGFCPESAFELVNEEEMTQQFKNMKFDVAAIAKELDKPHEEASRIIQEALFEFGYVWFMKKGVETKLVQHAGGKLLHCWDDGCITYSDLEDEDDEFVQHKIKQTFSIVPVEQEEFVELNGKKYNKKELEAALSMLKPVEEL